MTGVLDLTTARARQSHIFERQAEDWYCEPAWCWQRLFERKGFVRGMTVLDPACGLGTCVEAAHAAGMQALGSDIVARWEAVPGRQGAYWLSNFLTGFPTRSGDGWEFPDIIASNPPFKDAEAFATLALQRAQSMVCLLLPSKWAQGERRARWLATTPLQRILYLCPRPSMPPGEVIVSGGKPGNGTVDFSIFVWLHGYDGEPQVGWLHRNEVVA
ncbi:hypothetical protein E4V01_21845 [Methylorubrum sp. Q1]|uniref:hypothetical protein n=1 Tax=Methylorubrum sp. Q1 TaxID=2562453 RepID=UPI0010768FCD|nr:hypothetical protein [Methylorubrum sp. Q1]TFZ55568.1 hypothetical protein E4V01_21845 [Methylorubrum sp. Q1]